MFFFTYLKEILLGIVGFFALYLFNKNRNLKLEKEQLIINNTAKDKTISIQLNDINVTEKIKPSADINAAIDKLSETDK
jgi:hypothetical protein